MTDPAGAETCSCRKPCSYPTWAYSRILAPVLHDRFDGLAALDEVDKQVAAWRDAVEDGSARASAWPGLVNIPSKMGQVAAVRGLAEQRRKASCPRKHPDRNPRPRRAGKPAL